MSPPIIGVTSVPLRQLVVLDPIRTIDGRLHMHLGDWVFLPLRHGDETRLHNGWSAPALYVGCRGLLWLSLRHVDGHVVDWFLSEAGTYFADTVKSLHPSLRQALVRHVQDLLATPPGGSRDHALSSYRHMHLQTRHYIESCFGAEPESGPERSLVTQTSLPIMPPRSGALTTISRLGPSDFDLPGRFVGGWERDGDTLALIAGQLGIVMLDLPYQPAFARLKLEVRGTPVPGLLTVSVNGWTVGTSPVGPDKIAGSQAHYWIPPEALEAGPLRLGLNSSTHSLDPAPIFTLDGLELDVGPSLPAVAVSDQMSTLMARFESIGTDCEFGFVQRHFGLELLGLFRFAGARHLRNLLRLLETDLAGLGDPGSLSASLLHATVYKGRNRWRRRWLSTSRSCVTLYQRVYEVTCLIQG